MSGGLSRPACGVWRTLAEICMVMTRMGALKESRRNAAGNAFLKHISEKPATASRGVFRLGCLPVF